MDYFPPLPVGPTRLGDLYRTWLSTPAASVDFLSWIATQQAEWQGIVGDLLTGLFGPEEVLIQVVPILGPIQEQPEGTVPDVSETVVSLLKGRMILVFSMSSTQQVNVTAGFRDKRGNPAAVDGVPAWMVDNSEILALEPSADGFSCLIRAVGPLGDGLVTLTADADVGEGTTPVVGTLQVTITAGAATVITLQPGTAEEQP